MKKLLWGLLILGAGIMIYTQGNLLMQDINTKINNISILTQQKVDHMTTPLQQYFN